MLVRDVWTEDEVVRVMWEWIDDSPIFVHCDVKLPITPSRMRYIKRTLEELKIDVKKLGVDDMYTYSSNDKFCRTLGGEKIGTAGHKGVYRWSLVH